MNLTVITALLLCSLSWVSASGSESQTVEVQSGEDVTLRCSNMTRYDGIRFWFRLHKRTNIHCISVMTGSTGKEQLCDGFSGGRFSMWSNFSITALEIQSVELYDSGLYFCGFYEGGRPYFSVRHLKIRGSDKEHDGTDNQSTSSDKEMDGDTESIKAGSTEMVSVILGVVTVLLVNIIIALTVTVRKLQTAVKQEQNSQEYENVDSADVKKAALTLYAATDVNREPGSEREVKTRVVYTAAKKD